MDLASILMVLAIGSEIARAATVVPEDVSEGLFQVVERELVAQRGQHLFRERAVDPQLGELALEQRLLEEGVGHEFGSGDEAGRLRPCGGDSRSRSLPSET